MPTSGIHIGILTKSKTDVFAKLPKIKVFTSEVLTKVFIIESLTGACTTDVVKTKESKIVLIVKELRIVEHLVSIVVVGSVTEGFYSSVDEVVHTSIYDVLS